MLAEMTADGQFDVVRLRSTTLVKYDKLRRPIEDWVRAVRAPKDGDILLTKRMWGDGVNDRQASDDEPGVRQRGRLVPGASVRRWWVVARRGSCRTTSTATRR